MCSSLFGRHTRSSELLRQFFLAHKLILFHCFSSNLDLAEPHIVDVLNWAAQRLTLLQDLTSSKLSFLWVKPSSFELKDLSAEQLQQLAKQLRALPDFQKDQLNATLKDYAQQTQLKFPALMKTLRGALSGLKEGPGVAEMMEILGRSVVLSRLDECIKYQGKHTLRERQL